MTMFKFGTARPSAATAQAADRDYWLDRAEAHFELGEEAADQRASWAHLQLAGCYLDRAYGETAVAANDDLAVLEPEF